MSEEMREKIGNFLLPNAPTYIAACDSAEARIFLAQSRFGDWSEVKVFDNPDAAIRERDRKSDRPGRVFDSFGKGRHAMAPGETGRQSEVHRFARQVGGYLNRAISSGDFEHLVLISEPRFLGLLRRELSAATRRSLCYEMPMNSSDYDMNQLKSLFDLK